MIDEPAKDPSLDGMTADRRHFDVLVVGAGISGIGAGYHLQAECPDRTYAILESRNDIGGTWDLFRYPGIRSDSDMHTLGFPFRPWTGDKAIADGPSILEYLHATAREYGIDRKIRFQHHVEKAAWSSDDACWTIDVRRTDSGERLRFTCNFLFMGSGYYDYDEGYTPDFAGVDDFEGKIVHPQKWTSDILYAGKRVVVIGSGATAVTLVPAMAGDAAHVTMLQRSPSYILSIPAKDPVANRLRRFLPEKVAYWFTRWKNVFLMATFIGFCRRFPKLARRLLLRHVRDALGPDYDVETHFSPDYWPWDQRMCLVPDEDLFAAIRNGRVSVVTDHIDRFTRTGIRLESGRELEADLVVTATGLRLQLLAGIPITVDGEAIDASRTFTYKGFMLSGVPNLAMSVGYTKASWTLRADLIARYVCRLLNHMAKHGYDECRPEIRDPDVEPRPLLDLNANYILRAVDRMPKQGSKRPWRGIQNYPLERLLFLFSPVDDAAMTFSSVSRKGDPDRKAA